MVKRDELILFPGTFIEKVVGVIYRMAPWHLPRRIDEIVTHIMKYFQEHGEKIFDTYFITVDLEDGYDFVEKVLMGCDAFKELNLSYNEYKKGVEVDDDSRPSYIFTSAHSVVEEEHDFIDLDACIRNINDALYWVWVGKAIENGDVDIVYYNAEDRQ